MSGPVKVTVRALWRRAPLWRALVYLACLLSALVIFLPRQVPKSAPWRETAAYVPPPQPAVPPSYTPQASSPPASAPNAPTQPPPTSVPQNTDFTLGAPGSHSANNGAPPVAGVVGKVYSGFYPLRGRKLPLRPGTWTVLAAMPSQRPDADLENVFLGQIEGHELKGAVMFTDFQPYAGGWQSRFIGCSDRYNLASHVEDGDQGRQACWFVRPLYAAAWKRWRDRSTKMDALFRAAAGELDLTGVDYPQDLIEVSFHTANDAGALNAVYYFNPTDDGLTATPVASWLRSDWSTDNIAQYPQKLAYEKRVEAWGQQWWTKIVSIAALPRQ